MNFFKSKIEEFNALTVNIITFLTGVILVLLALLLDIQKTVGLIFVSIGTSIIASSVVVYLSSKYLFKQNRIKEIIEIWGLSGIYKTRAEMNISSNVKLRNANECIDIIAFGLKGFRETQSQLIEDKIRRGMKIRIVTINPNSKYLSQREKDEKEIDGQIKNTVEQLTEWVFNLKKNQIKQDQVQIKYYDTLPFDFYFRIDNNVFIGPYLYGISSQQTISYEITGNKEGFNYYTTYFERIWNNNELLKDSY
jgi:hypothetical protein